MTEEKSDDEIFAEIVRREGSDSLGAMSGLLFAAIGSIPVFALVGWGIWMALR